MALASHVSKIGFRTATVMNFINKNNKDQQAQQSKSDKQTMLFQV
jgi:hypothetical protein